MVTIHSLKNDPVFSAAYKRQERELYEKRRELVAQVEQLNSERDAALPGLKAKVGKANEKLAKAEKAYREAQREAASAAREQQFAMNGFSHKITRLESELRRTAPDEIDGMCRRLHEEQDLTRQKFSSITIPGKKNPWTLRRDQSTVDSNLPAILERVEQLNGLLAETGALRLKAVPDIDAALEAIAKRIPRGELAMSRVSEVVA